MPQTGLGHLVTRVVPFAWRGHRATLALSQSLFSSAGVDAGTQLLLKSLAALRDTVPARPRTLDLGCGVGVLGLAMALDGGDVVFRDRDSLALAFSAHNCRANGVEPAEMQAGLDYAGLGDQRFDLIVSNLPAKAGANAHEIMVSGLRNHLREHGLAVFVVVEPIADRIRGAADRAGLVTTPAEHTPLHTVFTFRAPATAPEAPAAPADPLAPYRRRTGRFQYAGVEYRIEAMHDLGEFDTHSHTTTLALEALARVGVPRGRCLVWNPGQGHIPAWLSHRAGGKLEITAAGRDLLALLATRTNAPSVRALEHTWSPALAGTGFDTVVYVAEEDPAARWEERVPGLLAAALRPGGRAVVTAGSTFVARLLRGADGFRTAWSRRNAGCRCVVLERS